MSRAFLLWRNHYNLPKSANLIPLANPFERPPEGMRRAQGEATLLEEPSCFFLSLQHTLNNVHAPDHLRKGSDLPCVHIGGAPCARLCLLSFERSPAVSSEGMSS